MNEYVIKADGSCVRRPLTLTVPGEVQIAIDDAVMARLQACQITKLPMIGTIGDQHVNACVVNEQRDTLASVALRRLTLVTTFVTKKKIVHPSFKATGETIVFEWAPPPDMLLMFCAMMHFNGESWASKRGCEQYLFALDSRRRAWLLPLANIFNDCRICTGVTEGNYESESLVSTLAIALADVQRSKWNDHLIKDDTGRRENSERMFRFTPASEGLLTMPPDESAHWSDYCVSVGTAIVSYL